MLYKICAVGELFTWRRRDALSLLLQKRALTMKVLHKENLQIFQARGWLREINCETIECRRWEKISLHAIKKTVAKLQGKGNGIKTRLDKNWMAGNFLAYWVLLYFIMTH